MTIAAQNNTVAKAAEEVLAADTQNLAARRAAATEGAAAVLATAAANAQKTNKIFTLKNVLKATAATAVVVGAGVYLYKRFSSGDSIGDVVADAAQVVTPTA